MVSISKINPILNIQNTNKAKNSARMALPAASALGILAGSSMGPIIPPSNAGAHIPGTSVDDSIGEVLSHTGEQLIDLGASAAEAIGHGVSSAADGVVGIIEHIIDSIS